MKLLIKGPVSFRVELLKIRGKKVDISCLPHAAEAEVLAGSMGTKTCPLDQTGSLKPCHV